MCRVLVDVLDARVHGMITFIVSYLECKLARTCYEPVAEHTPSAPRAFQNCSATRDVDRFSSSIVTSSAVALTPRSWRWWIWDATSEAWNISTTDERWLKYNFGGQDGQETMKKFGARNRLSTVDTLKDRSSGVRPVSLVAAVFRRRLPHGRYYDDHYHHSMA